jgi:hypothetical protein
MRLGVLVILFLIIALQANAQNNLVPNPSFEDTIHCPTLPHQIGGYLQYWVAGQGDFHCATCPRVYDLGVPYNGWGFQFPRTGHAYTGIYTLIHDTVPSDLDIREYVHGPLTDTLKANKTYCVSFL